MTEGALDGAAPARSGRFILPATVLASALAFIDGTVVTIALPVIQDEFQAGFGELQWIVNAYTLMLGSLILVGGSLGDRIGRRRVFAIGITVFAAASLFCAIAGSPTTLILARAIQGIGAALLVPQSLAIISACFPRETRGQAIGTWAAASAITTALGPPLGGLLIDTLSWRAAFWINLPLSAAALWLTFKGVPETKDEKAFGALDWRGSTIAALSLGSLTFGLTTLSDGSADPPVIIGALLVGAVGLAAFVRTERGADNPIVPLELFRSRAFVVANVVTLLLYGALAAILFLLPFDLIELRGMSPSWVGATLLPFGLIIGLLSRRAGSLSDVHGARAFLVAGSLLVSAGAGALALHMADYWMGVLAPTILMALGMAAVVSPLTTTVMNSAPDAKSGAASGVNNAASRVAGLMAVALLGALAALLFRLQGAPREARFGDLPEIGDPARAILEPAFLVAYSSAMAVAAVGSLLAAAAAFRGLREGPGEDGLGGA